jgi:hypothetical protein
MTPTANGFFSATTLFYQETRNPKPEIRIKRQETTPNVNARIRRLAFDSDFELRISDLATATSV